jgi:hypothetical protein
LDAGCGTGIVKAGQGWQSRFRVMFKFSQILTLSAKAEGR